MQDRLEHALGGEEVRGRRLGLAPARRPQAAGEQRPDVCALGRQRRVGHGVPRVARRPGDGARAVDRAELEQPHVLHPARRVAAQRVQQRAEQRRAHHGLLLGHRVLELDGALAVQPEPPGRLARREAPADGLGDAGAAQGVLEPAPQPLRGREAADRAAARGQRGGDALEAPQARDLLDEVGLAADVVAPPGGHGDVEAVLGLGHAEAQPGEDAVRVGARDGRAEQALRAGVAQPQRDRVRAGAADVDRPAHRPRAAELDHQLRGDGLALDALLGLQLLLEAARGLRAQAQPGRRALDVRPVPRRGLHQHARGRVPHLGAGAAHHARDRRRALGIVDHAHLRVEPALHVVERGHRLAVARAADDQRPARDQVRVEGVHRLPGEQHHVVGDVDDVVDRALAGRHQPRLQPQGRRRDRHVLEQPRGEAGAQVGRPHVDGEAGDRVARGVRVLRPRRRGERRVRGGVHLARDAVDAQAVRPVRRDLELEHVRGDRQHVGERGAGGERLVEDHDPVVVRADLDLVLGQDHAVGLLPAELGLLQPHPAGHHRAGRGDRDGLAGRDVRRAADDLLRLAVAEVDEADAQAVGVRMLLGREDLAHAEVLERGHAVRVDAVDLRAGEGEPRRELGRGQARVAVVVEPQQGKSHQPNCSRKRRSFSYMSRRSLTPCLRNAIRSIPMPKAKPWMRSGS